MHAKYLDCIGRYAQRANGFIQNRLAELFTIVKLRLTDADMTQTQGVKLGMH